MQWSLLIQRSFAKNRSTEGAGGVVWRQFWRVGHLFWVRILPWTWARAGAGAWAWAWAGTKQSHCLGWSKIARGDANAKLVIAGKNLMTHRVPGKHVKKLFFYFSNGIFASYITISTLNVKWWDLKFFGSHQVIEDDIHPWSRRRRDKCSISNKTNNVKFGYTSMLNYFKSIYQSADVICASAGPHSFVCVHLVLYLRLTCILSTNTPHPRHTNLM